MFLYQQEYNRRDDVPQALTDMFRLHKVDRGAREFATGLVRGVALHEAEIDDRIRALSENWDFNRLDPVDRAILRLAVFEMLHRDDVPPVVAINEAIELAKRFSTTEAPRFINGVLDSLRQELMRPARHPAG